MAKVDDNGAEGNVVAFQVILKLRDATYPCELVMVVVVVVVLLML